MIPVTVTYKAAPGQHKVLVLLLAFRATLLKQYVAEPSPRPAVSPPPCPAVSYQWSLSQSLLQLDN